MDPASSLPLLVDKTFLERIILQKHNHVKASLVKMNEPVRIDEGQGFLGYLSRVGLVWDGTDHHSLPESVIVKVFTSKKMIAEYMGVSETAGSDGMQPSNPGVEILSSCGSFEKLHNNECIVYDFLQKVDPQFPTPQYYYQQLAKPDKPGILIMDDLGSQAGCVHLFDGLSAEQAVACAKAIAELHAVSIQHSDWKSLLTPWSEPEIKAFNIGWSKLFEEMHSEFPEELDKCNKADYDIISHFDGKMRALLTNSAKHCTQVLCHGDAHGHNVMFEKKNGQLTSKLVAIIDWQVAHVGNPGEDLARLLCISMNADVRRKCEQDVLNAYYETLKRLLSVSVPYSLDELTQWYYRSMQMQALETFSILYVLTKKVQPGRFTKKQLSDAISRGVSAVQDTLAKADWSFLNKIEQDETQNDSPCSIM